MDARNAATSAPTGETASLVRYAPRASRHLFASSAFHDARHASARAPTDRLTLPSLLAITRREQGRQGPRAPRAPQRRAQARAEGEGGARARRGARRPRRARQIVGTRGGWTRDSPPHAARRGACRGAQVGRRHHRRGHRARRPQGNRARAPGTAPPALGPRSRSAVFAPKHRRLPERSAIDAREKGSRPDRDENTIPFPDLSLSSLV